MICSLFLSIDFSVCRLFIKCGRKRHRRLWIIHINIFSLSLFYFYRSLFSRFSFLFSSVVVCRIQGSSKIWSFSKIYCGVIVRKDLATTSMTTTTQDIRLDRVRGNRYHRLTGRPVYGFMASPLLTGTGVPVDGNGAATEPGSLVAACVQFSWLRTSRLRSSCLSDVEIKNKKCKRKKISG